MSTLEILCLERPSPALLETDADAHCLRNILQLQTPPALQLRLLQPQALQSLCVESICRRVLAELRCPPLHELPQHLARLTGDAILATISPGLEASGADQQDQTPLHSVLDHVYTDSTELAWVRPGFSKRFYQRQARALCSRAPNLREVHFSREIGLLEARTFLEELIKKPNSRIQAICGPVIFHDLKKLFTNCPNLLQLEILTDPFRLTMWEFQSANLTSLDIRTTVSLCLEDLSLRLPNIRTLSLTTWYKGPATKCPQLEASSSSSSPTNKQCSFNHLLTLRVTGYHIQDDLQPLLPSLKWLTLRRCTLPLENLTMHKSISHLDLKLVKNSSPADIDGYNLDSLRSLELHSQWGTKRRINLNSLSRCCPSLNSLSLRFDFYKVQCDEVPRSGEWFPQLRTLMLIVSADREADTSVVFSGNLPRLQTLYLKRGRFRSDLIASSCPQLQNLELKSVSCDGPLVPLPSVRRVIFRLTHLEVVEAISASLPALRQMEIHVGYMNQQLATAYGKLVKRLNQDRGIEINVFED